jgi:hypothetical protein
MKIGKNLTNLGEIDELYRHLVEIGDDCLLGCKSKIILQRIGNSKPSPLEKGLCIS